MKADHDQVSEERRSMLKSAGLLGAGALAATALGGTAIAADMEDHHHHAATSAKNSALAKSLHDCVATAEACIDHCLDMFKAGDTSLADCAISVQETMAFCAAHAKLASYNSKYLKVMSELGIRVCEDCRQQCLKHDKHVQCKECADACAECIKACKAFTA